jgi:dynein heavy chain
MLRHMHFVAFVDMSDEVISTIFGTILRGLCGASFPDLAELAAPLVQATLAIYKTVCDTLLPTPAKSHYVFNLRDLSKVFQGVLMGDPKSMTEPVQLARLWVHESKRVFEPRSTKTARVSRDGGLCITVAQPRALP